MFPALYWQENSGNQGSRRASARFPLMWRAPATDNTGQACPQIFRDCCRSEGGCRTSRLQRHTGDPSESLTPPETQRGCPRAKWCHSQRKLLLHRGDLSTYYRGNAVVNTTKLTVISAKLGGLKPGFWRKFGNFIPNCDTKKQSLADLNPNTKTLFQYEWV